jgi:hypothetical protein
LWLFLKVTAGYIEGRRGWSRHSHSSGAQCSTQATCAHL